MRRLATALAVAAVIAGPLATAQTASAALAAQDPSVQTQPAPARPPGVQLLDCHGTTGSMGCGPGWFWRDGWRGFACYPC